MATESYFYVGPDGDADKYRLRRQVGSGGEAQLWEAELALAGEWERVAVKVLRADHLPEMDRWKGRWAEQAEVLRFVRHPGVVGVREHFEGTGMHYAEEVLPDPRALYLVMNWVEGQTMRDWVLRRGAPSDPYESLQFLAQLADVLDWLHSGQATPSGRPVIHADVTPSNVIITPAGQAVLVDFGLARLAGGLSARSEGTLGFVAPEVAAVGAYSPATDRYAFGALTYFTLVGATPPPDPAAVHAGFSQTAAVAADPTLLDHLMSMFDGDPQRRPPCGDWIRRFRVTGVTSADVIGASHTRPVEPAAGPLGPPVLPPLADGTPPVPSPVRRRRGMLVAIGAVIVAAGITAGVVAATREGDDANDDGVAVAASTISATSPPISSAPEPTSAAAPPTTEARATTTRAATTTTVAATTTIPPTTVPRTTIGVPPTEPVPAAAYAFGSSCANAPQQVRTETITAPACELGGYGDVSERTLDVNIPADASRLTGQIVFSDRTTPVEVVGVVRVLLDGNPIADANVTFADPYPVDVDVTDASRVTFRFRVLDDKLAQPNLVTFVFVDATYVR